MRKIFFVIMATVALASCGGKKVSEQTEEQQATQISENIWQMTSGDVTVSWLPDMKPQLNKLSLFGDVPQSLVDSLGIQDGIPASMSAVLVKSGEDVILFDTGLGAPASNLIPSLDTLGYKPEDIKLLYLTHLHGDHIGGLVNAEGEKVFPNAQVYLSRVEYEAWMAMEDRNAQQKAALEPYADSLHLFEFGDVLTGNVKAMDAVGHTPGHTIYEVGSFIVAGDIMHGVALQMVHPEFCPSYDMDPEKAIESRKRIISYARENGLTMVGMHFPVPGFVN